jgi:transposase-like protein
MGIDGMSKSQVSELAKNLDVKVAQFRNRPLDEGPMPVHTLVTDDPDL